MGMSTRTKKEITSYFLVGPYLTYCAYSVVIDREVGHKDENDELLVAQLRQETWNRSNQSREYDAQQLTIRNNSVLIK
jgi:hypothetical protein